MPKHNTFNNSNYSTAVYDSAGNYLGKIIVNDAPAVISNSIVGNTSILVQNANKDGSLTQSVSLDSYIGNQTPLLINFNVASLNNTKFKYTTVGTTSSSGSLNSKKPNIYFNIKKNTFSDPRLLFRFRTNSLTGSSSATNKWDSDSNIKPISLTSATATNDLKPVSAYGKYFYELTTGKKILNAAINLKPTLAPTYTVLVFGLGRKQTLPTFGALGNLAQTNFTNLLNAGRIHKFVPSTYTADIYNFIQYKPVDGAKTNLNIDGTLKGQYFDQTNIFSIFTGSPLNDKKFISSEKKYYVDSFYSNYGPPGFKGNSYYYADYRNINYNTNDFYVLSNPSVNLFPNGNENFIDLFNLSVSSKFIKLPYNNMVYMPNNLNSNDVSPFVITPNGSASEDFYNFSLFFVEMFSFPVLRSGPNSSDLLVNQTFTNGILTSVNVNALDTSQVYSSENNYTIQLANLPNAGADALTRLYLMDYTCGTTYNIEDMYRKSRTLIESLAYDYRNLLIKSSTDLQISNSTKALTFPPTFAHPFLNMFFQ